MRMPRKIQRKREIVLLVEKMVIGQGNVPIRHLVIRRRASIVVKADIWPKNVKVQKLIDVAVLVIVVMIMIATTTTIDPAVVTATVNLLIVAEMIMGEVLAITTMNLVVLLEMNIHVTAMVVMVVPGLQVAMVGHHPLGPVPVHLVQAPIVVLSARLELMQVNEVQVHLGGEVLIEHPLHRKLALIVQ